MYSVASRLINSMSALVDVGQRSACTALSVGIMSLAALCFSAQVMATDLPLWTASDDPEDAPILTLRLPATESWQNWCDDTKDELAEYDIYHFCRSHAPRLVLEDKFSEKVLQNMKAGTLNVLHRTQLIRLVGWTGIEEKLQSKNNDILQGLSVELEPGLGDAYLHVKYRFD